MLAETLSIWPEGSRSNSSFEGENMIVDGKKGMSVLVFVATALFRSCKAEQA